MKYFLTFYFLILIKASIRKISKHEIPDEICSICLLPLNEFSNNEFINEIQLKFNPNKDYNFLYECSNNNHYFHTGCMLSHFENYFGGLVSPSENTAKSLRCPNCRKCIVYSDYIPSIIDVIISSIKQNPDNNFDKIALIFSINLNSFEECKLFIERANLSQQELDQIINAYREIYKILDHENLQIMVGRISNWVLYLKKATSIENSLIFGPVDEYYLNKEILIDKSDNLEFKKWLSNQKDDVVLLFFRRLIEMHIKYESNIFLKYLSDSIISCSFFRPHLFDQILKILSQEKEIIPELSDKNMEFFNEIEQSIEIVKKSPYAIFLINVRDDNIEEYERISHLKPNEKQSADELCEAFCDQISKVQNYAHYPFEDLIFYCIHPNELTYTGFTEIYDLIFKNLIKNPDKIFSITKKINCFLPKYSIFFMRYFFENLEYFYEFKKNSPEKFIKIFEINGIAIPKKLENFIFSSEKIPDPKLYHIFIIEIFKNFLKKTDHMDYEIDKKIYRWCLACSFITVLGINNKELGDILFFNLFLDRSFFGSEQRIRFVLFNSLEEISDKKATEIFDKLGKNLEFTHEEFHLMFIQYAITMLDYQCPNIIENHLDLPKNSDLIENNLILISKNFASLENNIISLNIYNFLKPHTFSYEILSKILSINFKNNIFTADLGILLVNSFNDSMLNKYQLIELIIKLISSQCFTLISEKEKERFASIIICGLDYNRLEHQDLFYLLNAFFSASIFTSDMIEGVLSSISISNDNLYNFQKFCTFFYTKFSKYENPGYHKLFIHFLSMASNILKLELKCSFFESFHRTEHNSYDILAVYLKNFTIKSIRDIKFIYNIITSLEYKLTQKELTECLKLLHDSIKSDSCELSLEMKKRIFKIYLKYKGDSTLLLKKLHPVLLIKKSKAFKEVVSDTLELIKFFEESGFIPEFNHNQSSQV